MKIDRLVLGDFETNSYVLRKNPEAKQALIIDTGLDSRPLIDFLKQNNLTPVALLLTHGHADHIAGVAELRENYPDVKVCIHKLDAEMLTNAHTNLSAMSGLSLNVEAADVIIDCEKPIEFAGITLQPLHTPGHTKGGICLYSENDGVIFVGDTLFAGSVGRTDFPGSSGTELITSIKEKLLPLPEDTTAYPGHGPATTIGQEKTANPFLQNLSSPDQ